MKKSVTCKLLIAAAALFQATAFGQTEITELKISVPQNESKINPMIYGQMLEDCNDKVIYGGLIRDDGTEHPAVRRLLKPLNIPVMRWPAGTYIHEYDWKKGIGPMEERPQVDCYTWGGVETNQFGTDEFLRWCKRMNIEPYINFNMGNDIKVGGSLGEALDWIEYVNGGTDTIWGKRRAQNGHEEPYNVKYWCIGNENYGPWGKHEAESAETYSKKFNSWARVIKFAYPDLVLLGVGHSLDWNKYVLNNSGEFLDILTLHFYMNPKVMDGELQNPEEVLFAPEKIETNIEKTAEILKAANEKFGRTDNPITVSVDEWNNRHQVFDGQNFAFSRHDPRRLFDAAMIAGMLNVFIRQSPTVSMANYIFPVNGHGIVRTHGDNDAFKAAIYPVFELYRKIMLGSKLDVAINGPRTDADVRKISIAGDMNPIPEIHGKKMTLVDSAATLDGRGNINVAIVNRSHESVQKVKVEVPAGYAPVKAWEISAESVNTANLPDDRDRVTYRTITPGQNQNEFSLAPCAILIVQFQKNVK